MQGRSVRNALLVAFAAACVIFGCASEAGAAKLKNKETGEIITGTLTKQKINEFTVFKTEGGETRFIKLEEWEILEADPEEPAPPETGTGTAPDANTGSPAPKTEPKKEPVTKAYILPVSGGIEHYALIEALQKGVSEAKKRRATVVIFRLNTPGGRVDLGEKIIDLIEEADDWATTVAWVQGDEHRALSCGAFIALATQKIFMAPGTTIGAATPYRMSYLGPEIEEKLTSAFRARFRALAQQRGHPVAIADAMVDNKVSVVQIFIDGKQMLVTAEEADRLEKEHLGDGRFKRGKVVSKPGELITLTDQEALEFEICSGIAQTGEDILKALGYEKCSVEEAAWIPDWAQKQQRIRVAMFEKYLAEFEAALSKASLATSRTSYQKCIKEAAQAFANIDKMAADPRYDVPMSQEQIDRLKARLQAYYDAFGKPF